MQTVYTTFTSDGYVRMSMHKNIDSERTGSGGLFNHRVVYGTLDRPDDWWVSCRTRWDIAGDSVPLCMSTVEAIEWLQKTPEPVTWKDESGSSTPIKNLDADRLKKILRAHKEGVRYVSEAQLAAIKVEMKKRRLNPLPSRTLAAQNASSSLNAFTSYFDRVVPKEEQLELLDDAERLLKLLRKAAEKR